MVELLIPLALALYFLPTIIVIRRDHPSSDAIFFVNLLSGWTLVGWLVALVWSLRRGTASGEAGPPNDQDG